MSRAGDLTRRGLLIGTAAVAGGLVVGGYSYRRTPDNPLLAGLGEGETALTPYVRVDGDGVTLILPRADVGQGAQSVQAMLLAEELDVDPEAVRLEPAPVGRAYYNSAFLAESTMFPSYEAGIIAETIRRLSDVPAKLIALQATGASSTVPDSYDKLRLAGAVARETLKAAAAEVADVDVGDLTTGNGAVMLPDGRRLSYAELAVRAGDLPAVTDVTLRDPAEWRFLGRPHQRTDIVAKSTGRQDYGIDMRLDGMLFAAVRSNPSHGLGAARADTSAAKAMRGVSAVVPITGGFAVIADNTWRAFRAAEAIEVEWLTPDGPGDTDAMWQTLDAHLAPDHGEIALRSRGDVDEGLAAPGATIVETEYRVPHLAHAALEPLNATVLFTGDRLDIWTGTQIPGLLRRHAAKIARLPVEAVHVHNLMTGGSFGRRLDDDYALRAVEVGLAVKGTPVKVTWSREEDFTADNPRPMALARGRGAARDGKVETLDLKIASASVLDSWIGRILMDPPLPIDFMRVLGAYDQPWAIPNYRVQGHRAPAMVQTALWRAPGVSANAFFHEGLLNELIDAAGADPLEERLRLCTDPLARRVLETVGDISGWTGTDTGTEKGRGLAFSYGMGVPCAQVVDVTKTDRGLRIDRVHVALDVGRVLDPVNIEAQVTGAVIFGLGHAMSADFTYAGHAPVETNFDTYRAMRFDQAPEFVVRVLEEGPKIRGAGEPALPPAAPALAAAVFAATGTRLREMPFDRHVDFA